MIPPVILPIAFALISPISKHPLLYIKSFIVSLNVVKKLKANNAEIIGLIIIISFMKKEKIIVNMMQVMM